MNITFRPLKAEEVFARVNTVSEKGFSLLLYKDARCDQDILDETVTPMGWQRKHYEVKGNMYCSVGIKDPSSGEWVWKDDCGTESNTEAEKGEASDSFKRACVNWGIGRELYTKLFIFINGGTYDTGKKDGRGKPIFKLSDPFARYTVTHLESKDGKITELEICCKRDQVYAYGIPKSKKPEVKDAVNELACPMCGKTSMNVVEGDKTYNGRKMLEKYGMCYACKKKQVESGAQ